ncbi:MAG: HAD family hydrolase [Muribaculaceae bacterium]|nr:HAD family hydrolase [Muribaculaceae bacterium]
MNLKIENLIFDFDGTLADTSALVVATMQKTIEEYGLPFRNAEEIKSTIGLRLDDIPKTLWPDKEVSGEKFAELYRKNFRIFKDKVPITLFPGVKDTLAILHEKGYRMAVATSRHHKSVVELSESFGILDYFSSIVGGDDVEQGKPNPESILAILKDNNWEKESSMMIGDMAVDILMGQAAGVHTCGVTYGNGKESVLKNLHPDFLIPEFHDLLKILK